MEHQKALNALEPFLALSKSASSPLAAIDLITRATSAANTFIFAELLLSRNIQALSTSPEHAPYLQILQIFCYGTYATHKATPNLPPLNPAQTLKLRQLSLLTLAQNPVNLTYDNLMKVLNIDSTRELENLVISAIYAGLLTGTLDPRHQRVAISSISPLRDVAPTSVPHLISMLEEWSSRCTSTLSTVEAQIVKIRADAARRQKEEKEWSVSVEKMIEKEGTAGKENVHSGKSMGGNKQARKGGEKRGFFGGGGAKDDADMDVDDEELEEDDRRDGGAKSQKKRTLGGVSLNFGR